MCGRRHRGAFFSEEYCAMITRRRRADVIHPAMLMMLGRLLAGAQIEIGEPPPARHCAGRWTWELSRVPRQTPMRPFLRPAPSRAGPIHSSSTWVSEAHLRFFPSITGWHSANGWRPIPLRMKRKGIGRHPFAECRPVIDGKNRDEGLDLLVELEWIGPALQQRGPQKRLIGVCRGTLESSQVQRPAQCRACGGSPISI